MNTYNAFIAKDPMEQFCQAVILLAVDDYRRHRRALRLNPGNATAKREISKIERFFKGPRYQMLTTVDGDYLIRKLREEG